ncbi:hypothetical protein [Collimonas sp. PA-H2]|uniref:hypothetical protein n=1 Tax=Collimonas sp. PA-H2 TaxID=1881062 RepID=UPI001E62D040|nr:hypothetical protein [Collimonas sp. PA-H2]
MSAGVAARGSAIAGDIASEGAAWPSIQPAQKPSSSTEKTIRKRDPAILKFMVYPLFSSMCSAQARQHEWLRRDKTAATIAASGKKMHFFIFTDQMNSPAFISARQCVFQQASERTKKSHCNQRR